MNVFKGIPLVATLALCGCGGSSDDGQAPTFANPSQSVVLQEDTSYRGQVSVTLDSQSIRYFLGSSANNGAVTINNNGEYTYTPDENFFGTDSIKITATDGSKSSSVVINFTIENVNDAPVLLSSIVSVTSSSTTQGKLEFFDVDGDTVTVKLVKAPEQGELVLNETTGEFTYTSESLSTINSSFTISYTDGHLAEPLIAVISLTPSYITNLDKHNYYYSSSKSHLKRAQAIADTINDDLILNEIREALAVSYHVSGFEDEAKDYIAKMTDELVRANTYKALADKYAELGLTDNAFTSLETSFALYSATLNNKGVENITNTDVKFFFSLSNRYISIDKIDEAITLLNQLKQYAAGVKEDTYSSSYGYFLNAAYTTNKELVESYLNDPTQVKRDQAKLVLNNYIELAEETPPYIQKRGSFKGEKQNQFTVLNLTRATGFAYQLGEIELAKQLLNKTLSYYGIVGLDSTYSYSATPYSDATAGSYTYPLTSLAGLIVALYGEQETNPVYSKLVKQSEIDSAKAAELKYIVLQKLENGLTIDDAFKEVDELYRNKSDLRNYVSLILDEDDGLITLLANDKAQLALSLIDKVNTLFRNNAFIADQTNPIYLSGYKGCSLATKLVVKLEGDANAQAQFCRDLAYDKLLPASNTKPIAFTSLVLKDLLTTYTTANDYSNISETITSLNNDLTYVLNDAGTGIKTKFGNLYENTGTLVQAGELDAAQALLTRSLELYNTYSATLTSEEREQILKEINDAVIVSIDSMLAQMSVNVANIPDYKTQRSRLIETIKSLVNEIVDATLATSDKEIQDSAEVIMISLTTLEMHDEAKNIINLPAFSDADRLELNAQRALIIAQKDDFLGTNVASVDTDYDGRPNFFLPSAKQENIEASGLVVDEDADGDGIPDDKDLTPIGD